MARRHVMAIDAQPLLAAIETEPATPRLCLDAESMWHRLRRRYWSQADEDVGDAARWLRTWWLRQCWKEGR